MAKIQGGDLMIFYKGKSIAYATNHTLEISSEMADTSNKDEGGGRWASSEVKQLSWTITSENLYSVDGKGSNFSDLFTSMVSNEKLSVTFAMKAPSDMGKTEVPNTGWSPNTGEQVGDVWWEGQAYITSLNLNAPNGEYASYTATFTGVGSLNITVGEE